MFKNAYFFIRIIFLTLLIISFTGIISGSASAVLKSDSAVLDLKLDIPIVFQFYEDSSLLYLDVDFVMIPSNDQRQKVLSSYFDPRPSSVDDDVVKFKLTSPADTMIQSRFRVETSADLNPVTDKVEFPIKNLNPSFLSYVSNTEVFDVNKEIQSLAIELSQGSDDLFKIVFSIAEWVNTNVEYDLDTVSPDKLSASWVLENRKGVCTEYSSLFISLLRSLGIPAREISGVAFTDSTLFPTGWGFHSWAEVYFPDYGWVSFDPTYGQYGFIDAGHIKLGMSSERDGKNSFSWRGRNIDVIPGETILDVDVLSTTGSRELSRLSVKTFVLEEEVGQNSYNFLRIDLQNNNNFYVAETIRFSGVDGLRFLSSRTKSVVLAPGESISVYLIFQVTRSINDGFVYTFPLRFYLNGQSFSSEFKANQGAVIVLEEDVNIFKDKEKNLLPGLLCDAIPVTRIKEELIINCESLNDQGLLCFNGFCKQVSNNFSIYFNSSEPGFFTKPVTFESSITGNSRLSFVKYLIIDDASLDLLDTTHSRILQPKSIGLVNVSLKKNSSSIPMNVSLIINHDYFVEEVVLGDIENSFVFTLTFPARNLKKGTNEILINASFYDVLGKEFSEYLIIEMDVEGLSLLDEVDFFIRRVYFWIKNLW